MVIACAGTKEQSDRLAVKLLNIRAKCSDKFYVNLRAFR